MNQIKIGKFISSKRKEKKLTQSDIAESLGVSNRAVSKWENGVSMPDYSIILGLCNILDISINELFSAEEIEKENNEKKLEENLLKMIKIKEENDKQMLKLEIVIGFISSITFLILIFISSYINMNLWLRITLILFGTIIFFIGMYNALKIEQVAGYYECANCKYKYIPTFKSIFLSTHINRTRKMKCPNCNKRCWHKKVIK